MSVIKLGLLKKKHQTHLYIWYFETEKLICKNWVYVCKMKVPHMQPLSCNGWFDQNFPYWQRKTKWACCLPYMVLWDIYTEPPGFKKVVYDTNISKIANYSERLKDHALRNYNFVNSFNVWLQTLQSFTVDHMCMENAKCSAKFCIACFQIQW